MVTKLQFLLFYTIFLFFITQISAMAGESIVSGIPPPNVPSQPSGSYGGGIVGFFDSIGYLIRYIFTNIGYFFTLMRASTTFALFGAVILTPFVIVLIWIILELIRGV
jgi:hypothetical protein